MFPLLSFLLNERNERNEQEFTATGTICIAQWHEWENKCINFHLFLVPYLANRRPINESVRQWNTIHWIITHLSSHKILSTHVIFIWPECVFFSCKYNTAIQCSWDDWKHFFLSAVHTSRTINNNNNKIVAISETIWWNPMWLTGDDLRVWTIIEYMHVNQ